MTTFVMEEALAQFVPWDFSISRGGVAYATKAPLLGHLLRLAELQSSREASAITEVRSIADKLFSGEGGKPNLEEWTMDEFSLLFGAVMEYSKERSKKNQPMIAKQVAKALTPSMPEGTK